MQVGATFTPSSEGGTGPRSAQPKPHSPLKTDMDNNKPWAPYFADPSELDLDVVTFQLGYKGGLLLTSSRSVGV